MKRNQLRGRGGRKSHELVPLMLKQKSEKIRSTKKPNLFCMLVVDPPHIRKAAKLYCTVHLIIIPVTMFQRETQGKRQL
jgi:hypothetical protein